MQTNTADILRETQNAGGGATSTSTLTTQPQENPQPQPQPQQSAPTATNTNTATATRETTPTTDTAGTAAAEATTAPPTSTIDPASLPTATSSIPDNVGVMPCIPGDTITLTGVTQPNIPLLVFFDQRPVGGGFSLPDGNYSLRLLIGEERPGTYLVDIEERGTHVRVQQIACEVPSQTPTPTPPLIP